MVCLSLRKNRLDRSLFKGIFNANLTRIFKEQELINLFKGTKWSYIKNITPNYFLISSKINLTRSKRATTMTRVQNLKNQNSGLQNFQLPHTSPALKSTPKDLPKEFTLKITTECTRVVMKIRNLWTHEPQKDLRRRIQKFQTKTWNHSSLIKMTHEGLIQSYLLKI